MKKIYKIFLSFVLIIISLFFFIFKWAMIQEWNPLAIFKWFIFINFTKNDIIEIEKWKFMSKNVNSDLVLKSFMLKKWYKFLEQMWAWYFFENDKWQRKIVIWKMLSRFYRIYYIDL